MSTEMEHHDVDSLLDRAIGQIEGTEPDPAVAEAAAERVWSRLATADSTATDAAAVEEIRGCEDYQALIPAFLAGELAEARRLLVEDHTRSCVPCRRALKATREGKPLATQPLPVANDTPATVRPWRPSFTRWAAAAALIAGLGVSFFLMREMSPFDNPQSATIASLDGDLFRVASAAHQPLAVGDVVAEGQSIRTGREGGAVVRLADGSLVEMRARSEISIDEGRRGTTIELERGNVIVQAAKQRERHLYVSTDDCLVSVTGTIFSVNHGTKGSRVSVIEGEVKVAFDGDEETLAPGDQVVTQASLVGVPVADEIAWSQDVERYLDLLEEITDLKRTLRENVPRLGQRTSTQLLDLMPENTMMYAALPNLGETVAETHRLLQERLAENPDLTTWWQEQGQSEVQPMIDDVVGRLAELGDYLGSEIVIGATLEGRDTDGPLVLAELADPAGLRDFIERQLVDAEDQMGQDFDGDLIFVDDPLSPPATGDDALLIWLHESLLVATPETDALTQVARLVLDGDSNPFVGSDFHQALASLYQDGVELVVGVDLAAVVQETSADDAEAASHFATAGFDNVQHLLAEQKRTPEHTQHRLTVGFEEARHGIASWIAEPAPMGSLDFISPDAKGLFAAVFKDPAAMLDDLAAFEAEGLGEVLQLFRERHGLDLRDDFAAALGGEVALAIDGPLLPTPAWKLVLEVYDPARFQWAVEQGLTDLADTQTADGEPAVTLTYDEVGGRTLYTIDLTVAEIHYTFVEGYLLAAPSRAMLDRALRFRDSGYSILDSDRFEGLLPDDGRNNFSLVAFYDLAGSFDVIAERMAGSLTDEQRERLDSVNQEMKPTLGYAYADTDRITVATVSGGDTLSSLLLRLFGVQDPASFEQLIPELLGVEL